MSTIDSGFDSGSSPELHATSLEDPPMSRTHQYRKVMKPLLERKRRARINKCLDNLKDLMVTALQSEGESITKLEKADVLELTVKHLQKLKRQNALGLTPQATYAGRFKSGYAHCAQEVSKYMTGRPDVSVEVRTRLFSHLSNCMQALESMPPSVLSMAVPTQQGPMSPPHSVSPPLYSSNTAYQQHAVKPTPAIEPAATNNNNNFRVKSESLSAAINSPPPTSMMRLKNEDQVVPLDLMTKVGKENQAQDLTMSTLKSRQPLSNVNTVQNDKWRPW